MSNYDSKNGSNYDSVGGVTMTQSGSNNDSKMEVTVTQKWE